MLDSLSSLPLSSDEAYEDIMDRVGNRGPGTKDLAARILSWVYNARRRLKMDELCELLSVKKGDKAVRAKKWHPKANRVVTVCESLIVEDSEGIVRFTHYTVEEYLRDKGRRYLPPGSYVAETCLTYLSFHEFERGPCLSESDLNLRIEQHLAVEYVAGFWGFPARQSEESCDVTEVALTFLTDQNKRNSMLQMEAFVNSKGHHTSFRDDRTILHVIAKNGLATICQLVLNGSLNRNEMYRLSYIVF
jgi:hypothetical protein